MVKPKKEAFFYGDMLLSLDPFEPISEAFDIDSDNKEEVRYCQYLYYCIPVHIKSHRDRMNTLLKKRLDVSLILNRINDLNIFRINLKKSLDGMV